MNNKKEKEEHKQQNIHKNETCKQHKNDGEENRSHNIPSKESLAHKRLDQDICLRCLLEYHAFHNYHPAPRWVRAWLITKTKKKGKLGLRKRNYITLEKRIKLVLNM